MALRRNAYAVAPYRAGGLPIYAIGLVFDAKTRQLTDAAVEKFQ